MNVSDRMKRIKRVCIMAALMSASEVRAGGIVELSVGIHRIEAELANTYESRDAGLNFRPTLGSYQGMLFVFPQVERHCMWMRDTLIPLSVAFIDVQGRMVNVEEMEPQTVTRHCARSKVRYALEMPKGWFEKRRIRPGALISGIETAPPAQ